MRINLIYKRLLATLNGVSYEDISWIFPWKKITYFYYFESCQDYEDKRLKAFSVNNGWAGFIVFLFAYPHGLEG